MVEDRRFNISIEVEEWEEADPILLGEDLDHRLGLTTTEAQNAFIHTTGFTSIPEALTEDLSFSIDSGRATGGSRVPKGRGRDNVERRSSPALNSNSNPPLTVHQKPQSYPIWPNRAPPAAAGRPLALRLFDRQGCPFYVNLFYWQGVRGRTSFLLRTLLFLHSHLPLWRQWFLRWGRSEGLRRWTSRFRWAWTRAWTCLHRQWALTLGLVPLQFTFKFWIRGLPGNHVRLVILALGSILGAARPSLGLPPREPRPQSFCYQVDAAPALLQNTRGFKNLPC